MDYDRLLHAKKNKNNNRIGVVCNLAVNHIYFPFGYLLNYIYIVCQNNKKCILMLLYGLSNFFICKHIRTYIYISNKYK